jgi:hypothetical protein
MSGSLSEWFKHLNGFVGQWINNNKVYEVTKFEILISEEILYWKLFRLVYSRHLVRNSVGKQTVLRFVDLASRQSECWDHLVRCSIIWTVHNVEEGSLCTVRTFFTLVQLIRFWMLVYTDYRNNERCMPRFPNVYLRGLFPDTAPALVCCD